MRAAEERLATARVTGGTVRQTTTYRAFIDQPAPIVPGQAAPLNVTIVDQFGKPFTGFDPSPYGQFVVVGAASRDLSSLFTAAVQTSPGTAPGGMGGGMGGSAAPQPTPAAGKPAPTPAGIKPPFIFPTAGQYVVFVHFWPAGGDEQLLTVPLAVGSATTPAAALTPDQSLTRTEGDLRISLQTEGPLRAGQYNYITFEVLDAAGQPRSNEINILSGDFAQLDIVDEKLTTLIQPDFVSRRKLQFSAYFPKPGRYKAWFTFFYAPSADLAIPPGAEMKYRAYYLRAHPDQVRRLAYVIDVQEGVKP
jgi:hypothetical protein